MLALEHIVAVLGYPFKMPSAPAYTMFLSVVLVDAHWASPLLRGSWLYQATKHKTIELVSFAIHPQR